jgi:hypothetical protein
VKIRVACALVLCLSLVACGGDDEESSPRTQAPVVIGEFVGTASDDETYVGLHASGPSSRSEAQVVAYVCNRRVGLEGVPEVAEWFTGTATGTDVDLTSQTGRSHLRATLAPGGAKGTVQLPDGRSITFQTVSSDRGPAGIFEVGLDGDGNLVGTSRAGKKLKLSPFQRDGVPGYTGAVTHTDGRTVPYELFVRGGTLTPEAIAGMGTPRTIILEDGTSRGILDPIARKGKATTS